MSGWARLGKGRKWHCVVGSGVNWCEQPHGYADTACGKTLVEPQFTADEPLQHETCSHCWNVLHGPAYPQEA